MMARETNLRARHFSRPARRSRRSVKTACPVSRKPWQCALRVARVEEETLGVEAPCREDQPWGRFRVYGVAAMVSVPYLAAQAGYLCIIIPRLPIIC
jgi:hypothetical protein